MILERRKKYNVIISGPTGMGGVQGGVTEEVILNLDSEGRVGPFRVSNHLHECQLIGFS